MKTGGNKGIDKIITGIHKFGMFALLKDFRLLIVSPNKPGRRD